MSKIPKKAADQQGDFTDDFNCFLANYSVLRMIRTVVSDPDKGWRPQVDVYETDEELIVVVEIAGVSIENISLTLDKDILTIAGEREEVHPKSARRQYHKLEIDFGPCKRSIKLPAMIDQENVQADLINGLLVIKMAKVEGPQVFRKINIK